MCSCDVCVNILLVAYTLNTAFIYISNFVISTVTIARQFTIIGITFALVTSDSRSLLLLLLLSLAISALQQALDATSTSSSSISSLLLPADGPGLVSLLYSNHFSAPQNVFCLTQFSLSFAYDTTLLKIACALVSF